MRRCVVCGKVAEFIVGIGSVLLLLTGCDTGTTDPGDGGEFNEELRNLRLTEINYNPENDDTYSSDNLEFIELKNIGTSELSLKNVEITDGVVYAFPDTAKLASGGFVVLAASAEAFEHRYGFAPYGVYSGVLKNGGESITLKDTKFNELIFTQFYSNDSGWAALADGKGYSLVPVDANPAIDATGPAKWRRSYRLYGSPGANDTKGEVDSKLFSLRFTEIYYNPGKNGSDSVEFIEIKNVGTTKLDLTDVGFSTGISYIFPDGASIDANQIIVLVADSAAFKKRYPGVTPFGIYSGQLANDGEKITLIDIEGDTVLAVVDYNDGGSWPSAADGDGYSLVSTSPNPEADQNNPAMWRQSRNSGGSPGKDDPGVVIVNEVLTHTDPPDYDAIELYNPGADPVDISGWYLSDSRVNPLKFRIPDETVIAAGGYLVFDESNFNVDTTLWTSFTLNSHGEEVVLISDSNGCLAGYCNGFKFGEIENGVSVGRYITSEGKEVFVPQKEKSLGEANKGPRQSPVIISEIMYHAFDDSADYIEITNISGEEVPLYHPDSINFTWKVEGFKFSFPSGLAIQPGESIIIGSAADSITEAEFRDWYSIGTDVRLYMTEGVLSNSSEKIQLLKPEDPYMSDSTVEYPYMVYDEVKYEDGNPWPSDADGAGKVLQRIADRPYGNDPASWEAVAPTPGTYTNK